MLNWGSSAGQAGFTPTETECWINLFVFFFGINLFFCWIILMNPKSNPSIHPLFLVGSGGQEELLKIYLKTQFANKSDKGVFHFLMRSAKYYLFHKVKMLKVKLLRRRNCPACCFFVTWLKDGRWSIMEDQRLLHLNVTLATSAGYDWSLQAVWAKDVGMKLSSC